jgi:uncharacterized membrane protein YbhN (UPF0104 family)
MESFYRPAIAYPVFLSVIAYVFFFGGCYLLAMSIHLPINVLYLTFCVSVVNIVSLVTFLGLGTRDAALIILFKLVGFQDQAEAYSMLLFFVGVILFSLVGLGCYVLKPFGTNDPARAVLKPRTNKKRARS